MENKDSPTDQDPNTQTQEPKPLSACISSQNTKESQELEPSKQESNLIQMSEIDLSNHPKSVKKNQSCHNIKASIKSSGKPFTPKSSVHNKTGSLFEKEAVEKSKFNFLKQKIKSNRILELRQVPQINKSSIKMLIQKEAKDQKAKEKAEYIDLDHYDPKLHEKANVSELSSKLKLKDFSGMNSKLLKEAMKIRENLKETTKIVENHGNDVISRTKILLDKKKALNEKKKHSESLEIAECTFKPYLFAKTPKAKISQTIMKQSKSGLIANIPKSTKAKNNSMVSVAELFSRVPPPCKSMNLLEKPNGEIGNAIVSEKYFQLSPYMVNVKYREGFNENEIMEKAHPMIDYKIV
ncbi:hypothetical protein SteCoe_22374 [Stentor coeruleus]|uniref:Uncharacterized protein n=1 Tax=Stentor coeruleus TaxID=5963 RepID=A0A1R2BMF5_9CILI|nr:hypothetical protein SteCoe_22374 [Stentor coeruleus]